MDQVTLLSWRTPSADAATLEQATFPLSALESHLRDARQTLNLPGLCYIATCQRVLWVLQQAPPDAQEALRRWYASLGRGSLPLPERHVGFEAFRHLSEVASSLDSLVPGEPQVLGQVKQAVRRSDQAGVLGPDLRHVFDLVLSTAKTVRSQTRLFEGKVSLVPLAKEAMADAIATTERPAAAIVGTGEIGSKAAELVRSIRPDATLHVVSRSEDRARASAQTRGATGHTMESFLAAPPPVQLLVLAMEVDVPFVSASWLARLAARGPVTVLDLALPRNAEAPEWAVPGLRLIQLDDLTRLSEAAKRHRDAAYDEAVRVLEDELDKVRHDYDLRCHASALHQLTQRFLAVSERRWRDAAAGVDKEDPKARKWYEQTVRALLHEATAIVKEPPRGDQRP